jgi:hypothetical protein
MAGESGHREKREATQYLWNVRFGPERISTRQKISRNLSKSPRIPAARQKRALKLT